VSASPSIWIIPTIKISKIIDFENDSIRFYYMGKNWERKVESMGKDDTYNPDTGTLLL